MGTTGQESSATTLRKTLPRSLLSPQGTGTKNAEAPQTTGAALSGQGQKQNKMQNYLSGMSQSLMLSINYMSNWSVGESGFLLTLITRGWSPSNFFGVSSRSITLRGNFWAQPVQLAGMGSDSFCSRSFVHQGSKSERGRDMEKVDIRTQQVNPVAPATKWKGKIIIVILKANNDKH